MRSLGRSLLLAAMAWMWARAGVAIAGSPDAPSPDADQASRQILVLLRLPPPHFRPGGAYGDAYDDTLGRGARRRIAAGLARSHGLLLVTDWPMPLLGVDCYVMAAPAGRSVDEEVERLSRDPAVVWSEPMRLYQAQAASAAPDDPLYRAQPAASQWRLADLHQLSTGRHVLVAVVDSQVEVDHPDLAGQVQIARSFVAGPPVTGEAHGTGVAGVIAAREGNGIGIAGVAPGARLMALRACWQTGPGSGPTVCNSLTLAEALHFAIEHRAQVINLSLGGPPDILLGRLIDVALARDITVVGAYDRGAPGGGFPASHRGVLAVADAPVEGYPDGPYTAPGRDIPTTQPGGRWSLVGGSSFAAAHVSGLVALARQGAAPGAPPPRLVAVSGGGGAVDACATLMRALGPHDRGCARPVESPALVRR